MKYLITKIKYSIEQEDIDAYREDEGIDEDVTDEEVREKIQDSLPSRLIVDIDEPDEDEYEEKICDAISDATGWCIECYEVNKL